MSTDTDYTSHEIIPGVILQARRDLDEDQIGKVVRQCRVIALGRDRAIARIKECIDELVRIDEACGGEDDGLVRLSESMGWISNFTTHTTDDYRRALLALIDVISDEDLPGALEEAEHQIAQHSAKGGAS